MGKTYTNAEELEEDYTLFKAHHIYGLIKNSFQMEKEMALVEGVIEEEALEEAETDFYERVDEEIKNLSDTEPMDLEEEKEILADIFEFMINLNEKLEPSPDYHPENFELEREISRSIGAFYFDMALEFLYVQDNRISNELKEEAYDIFGSLFLFKKDNFFTEA